MSRHDDAAERAGELAREGAFEETFALGGVLGALTRGLAFVGGLFLLATIVITLVSVTGRYAFGAPVPGDYELVEITCAIGVFLFFPYTQAIGGNIVAEFFTAGLPALGRRLLDVVNDVVFALVAMTLTWRLYGGLVDKYTTGETSILIGIPLWWAYCVAVASMALLSVVCWARAAVGAGAMRR